jgi:hypothetical protein
MDYKVSGGRVSFGDAWFSYIRSGRNGLLLVSEIPGEWRFGEVFLRASTGPVWRLP